MDCNGARQLLFLFVDGELEGDEHEPLRRHLSECPGCAKRVVYTTKLVTVIRERCARQAAPNRLRLRILSSFAHRQGGS